MESKQYTIGEFASMNKVSTRMLRHYDKIGLMRPVSILPNGYRCYGEEQIDAISQIKRLRDCDFLLEEIEEILRNDNPQFMMEAAKRKLAELQDRATKQQTAMELLRELTQEKRCTLPTPVYGVSLTMRGKTNLLIQTQPISLENVEDAFDELYRFLQRKKLQVDGYATLFTRFDDSKEACCQVGVPIAAPCQDEHYQTFTLPAAPMLSVMHYGDYYSIGHAYSALLHDAQQNNHPIVNLFLERYFLDSSHSVNSADYVTEISVALKNTP